MSAHVRYYNRFCRRRLLRYPCSPPAPNHPRHHLLTTTNCAGRGCCCMSTSTNSNPNLRKPARSTADIVETVADQQLWGLFNWLSAPHSELQNAVPPSIHTRYTFRPNPVDRTSINVVTIGPKTSIKSTHSLSSAQSLQAALNLLPPLKPLPPQPLLLRQPSHLPPLTIEFSSPNIAKPLHMGHLRSTLTGSFVRNITELAGHAPTKSICFLGDWGRQFGILHAGVEQELSSTTSEKSQHHTFTTFTKSLTLPDLLRIYVEASRRVDSDLGFRAKAMAHSSALEYSFSGNAEASDDYGGMTDGLTLWTHTRSITLSHLQSCYSALNITFDRFEGESEFRRESDPTREALHVLEASGLSKMSGDGCLRVSLEGDGKSNGPDDKGPVLLKQDGSSVYLLRDIACALKRITDWRIANSEQKTLQCNNKEDMRYAYVVDSGQTDHFRQLFGVLRRLNKSTTNDVSCSSPLLSSTHNHIPFNRVGGMSTRAGKYVLLSDVIEEGTRLMHEERRKSRNARNIEDYKVSEQLAVSGLIVHSLRVRRMKPYDFDWAEALRTVGNTGVTLQYTWVRLSSLFRRIREEIGEDGGWSGWREGERELGVLFQRMGEEEPDSRNGKVVMDLIVCLMNYEDTFWNSYIQLEPCLLLAYVFNLSDKISRVLATIRILDAGLSDPKHRDYIESVIWLLGVGERVLGTCMQIVGIRGVQGDGF